MLVSSRRCHRVLLVALAAPLFFLLLLLSLGDRFRQHIPTSPPAPDLPLDYRVASVQEKQWCQERYGVRYLEDIQNSSVSLCRDKALSSFTCFLSSTAGQDTDSQTRMDAMCYGQLARYDVSLNKFRLQCDIRHLTPNETAAGVPSEPGEFPSYWYETGPRVVMDRAVVLENTTLGIKETQHRPRRNTILLKREGKDNLWHSLMEIISLSWSLDVLQISLDPHTEEPYLSATAGSYTQIVLLDDHGHGPYFDLWGLFAKLPIRHIKDLDESEPASNLIIPFAGGSNTLWQGDWVDLDCRDSLLVKTFVSRALNLLNIPSPPRDGTRSL